MDQSAGVCQDIDMRKFIDDADQLGIMLKQAQSLLGQSMDHKLRPLGLSVPQFACLRALRDTPGLSGSELSRRMFVSRQSMNGVVLGLEKRELIARPSDKEHGRIRQAELTTAGCTLLGEAEGLVAETVHSMISGVSAEEIGITLSVLSRMSSNLADDPADNSADNSADSSNEPG